MASEHAEPVEQLGLRRRRTRRKAAMVIAAPVLVVVALITGGVWVAARIAPAVIQRFGEYDGFRPLLNGYDLWLLKGYARSIMLDGGTGPTTVPSNWDEDTHEVGAYGIRGDRLFGYLLPYRSPSAAGQPVVPAKRRYFIVDTLEHVRHEFDDHASWTAALLERGIDPAQVEWQD